MITEIAELSIKPDSHDAFLAAVKEAVPLFKRAKGCKAVKLERLVERPDVYHLVISWETLENHTVDFRGSDDFQAWRGLVGGFFAEPPRVEHSGTALVGF
ncbi:MAG TPA: antibiotic biosynthesis monooxygenase family protein [Pseudoduganella sp.]|jgi:heme-degrading monooxygenase HmoA